MTGRPSTGNRSTATQAGSATDTITSLASLAISATGPGVLDSPGLQLRLENNEVIGNDAGGWDEDFEDVDELEATYGFRLPTPDDTEVAKAVECWPRVPMDQLPLKKLILEKGMILTIN